ncbi:MAG TPA: hypothetical protein VNU97_09390 [Rhizomicrobium sp.]|jgi:hypothetical protein|nr:hypothetical protein [Rhizomicrobium sp.]
MSSAIRVGSVVLFGILAALGIILVFSENARLVLGALLQTDPGPPAIAGNISCNDWRNCDHASRQFDEIVEHRFPIGMSQQAVEAALLGQHFERYAFMPKTCTPRGARSPVGVLTVECPDWDQRWNPKNELVYHWGRIPCGSTVGVRWSADRVGRIVHREGYFYYACM